MKERLTTILFIVILCITQSQAQNYNPIVNGTTPLFVIEFDGYYALHVDSITSDPKGVAYHFSKTWSEKTTNCNTYYKTMWTGSKCIASQDTYYFFNQNNDTITFKPSAALNSKWVVYRYSDGKYIEGVITDKANNNSLGDSITTITLQVKNIDGSNASSGQIGVKYLFSKNNGIRQLTNFDTFPEAVDVYNISTFQLYTPRTLFNFELGTEFHYKKIYSTLPSTYTLTNIIRKVIGVSGSINDDQITYTFQQIQEKHTQEPAGSSETISYLTDTVSETYHLNLPLYYPGQAITESNPLSFYYGMSSYEQFLQLNNPIFGLVAHYDGIQHHDNCWNFNAEMGSTTMLFKNGMGLSSRVSPSPNGMGQDREDLVYFKNNEIKYGQPLILSTYTITTNAQLSLFPNPLRQGESLHYNTGNFKVTDVRIYNASGNTLELPAFSSSTLDVSNFAAGLYIVQFMNDKNEYVSAKLVIK